MTCGTMTSTFVVMVISSVHYSQRGCAFFPKRRTMKNLNKVAMLFAAAAIALPMAASAQSVQPFPAKPVVNPTADQLKAANGSNQWRSSNGMPVMNGTNELCWRNANWTPATAYPGCDGAALPPPPPPPAPVAALLPSPRPLPLLLPSRRPPPR
jgi:OOP family OmpA-OmpF porin